MPTTNPLLSFIQTPVFTLVLFFLLVGFAAIRWGIWKRLPLLGGALAASFAAPFTLGITDGLIGMQLLALSVVEPSPWRYIVISMTLALLSGIAALTIGSRIVQAHITKTMIETMVMLFALVYILPFIVIFFHPLIFPPLNNHITLYVLGIIIFFCFATIGSIILIRGARFIDRIWQANLRRGKVVLSIALVLLGIGGILCGSLFGSIPSAGSFDGRCFSSFVTVHDEAKRQQWQHVTQTREECDGSTGRTTIRVHLENGQDMICRTGVWGEEVECEPDR